MSRASISRLVIIVAVVGLGLGAVRPEAGAAAAARGPAYWLAGGDGGVFGYGDAGFRGSLGNSRLNAPVVAMAATPSGNGYWLAASDGGVFAFGDAGYHGGHASRGLHAPVAALAATPTGAGYWLAGADGGVFAFGDAGYYGSAANRALNAPIVGIASTWDGKGYWLAAADGGVFAFGDAGYHGGHAAHGLRAPVVAIAATSTGSGYWLAGADGGVFAYGDAAFHGSAANHGLNAPIVGLASTWDGSGYWLAAADGGVFAYGNAGYFGSRAGRNLHRPVTAVAAGLAPERPLPATLSDTHGYDISWPQCGSAYPVADVGFGIVGVTGGRAFTVNPCLADEVRWSHSSGQAAGLYVNVNAPDGSAPVPPNVCAPADAGCQMAAFGAATVDAAWSAAAGQGVSAPMWWLDVETANTWTPDAGINGRIIQGAVAALRRHGVAVGLYSTPQQWATIAGDLRFGLPVWAAGAPDPGSAGTWCDGRVSFNGGPVWLVQALPTAYDEDAACAPLQSRASTAFVIPRVLVPTVVEHTVVRHGRPGDPRPGPARRPFPHAE